MERVLLVGNGLCQPAFRLQPHACKTTNWPWPPCIPQVWDPTHPTVGIDGMRHYLQASMVFPSFSWLLD